MPKTYELDLGDYWRIIKRRKAIVLATFAVITSAIWMRTSRLAPVYEASSTIKIEKPFAAGGTDLMASSWELGDFIESRLEIIHSEGVAQEAALQAGLIEEGMSQEKIDKVASQFMGVSAARRGQTNIIDLSVQADDPEQAAFIANKVALGYQSWSLKDQNAQARKVRLYVENLLKENEENLQAKENELKHFKEESPMGASLASFQSQLVDLELKLSNLLEKYTYRHPEVIELQAQIGALRSKLGEYPQLELEHNQLTREVDSLKNIYGGLKQKYEDAKIAEAQTASGVTILDLAAVPGDPIGPNTTKNVMVGAVVAMILGLLLAFVKENVDTSISTIEEVEEFLQVPILGVIPEIVQGSAEKKWHIRNWLRLLPFRAFQRSGGKDITNIEDIRKLVTLGGAEHHFTSLEAYKTLRTNVNFATAQKKGQILEITSAGAREGKSITALNLALSLAENGQKTCLISADLRREMITRMMGVSKEPGLVEVLTKETPWESVMRKTTDFLVGEVPPEKILKTMGIDNLYLLPPGRLPPNPAEILSLEKMKKLLQELKQNFDVIILDTPPVLPVSDASILAPSVDGVILIYQVGQTARGALKRAKIQIANTGTTILGVVLNNIKAAEMRMAPTYYYYYKEYYGPGDKVARLREKGKVKGKHWWDRFFAKAA